jgi:hypothetical protein
MNGEGSKRDRIVDAIKDIFSEAAKTGAGAAGTVVITRSAEAVAEATKPRKTSKPRPTKKAAKKGGRAAAKKRAAKKKSAAKKKPSQKTKKTSRTKRH